MDAINILLLLTSTFCVYFCLPKFLLQAIYLFKKSWRILFGTNLQKGLKMNKTLECSLVCFFSGFLGVALALFTWFYIPKKFFHSMYNLLVTPIPMTNLELVLLIFITAVTFFFIGPVDEKIQKFKFS